MVEIKLPISDEAAKACVIAADRLGVEPWELAVHALAHKAGWFDAKRNYGRPAPEKGHDDG